VKTASVDVLSPLNRTVAVRSSRPYRCPDCRGRKVHFLVDPEGGISCVDCVQAGAPALHLPEISVLTHCRSGYTVEAKVITEMETLFLARIGDSAPQVFWKRDWQITDEND